MDLHFFEDRLSLPEDERPPIIAALIRSQRGLSLGFYFDHAVDGKLRHLDLPHEVGDTLRATLSALGTTFKEPEGAPPPGRRVVDKLVWEQTLDGNN